MRTKILKLLLMLKNKALIKKNRPILVGILIVLIGGAFIAQKALADNGNLVLSGTVEGVETNIPTMTGGQVKQVFVDEGDAVKTDERLVYVGNETVTSPYDGVVLERLVEPYEYAAVGSTVVVITDLNTLYLKIYVPEDIYGRIALGQTYAVTVDSFPGMTFSGTVTQIASQAEFTPRNVQTTDSRKTTVFAVKLSLAPSGGKLKPGMPADVHLQLR